jgi:hypothetical protein
MITVRNRLVAVADLVEPLVEVERADDAALQRHVVHAREAGQLADVVLLLVAVPVLDHVDAQADLAALPEPGSRPVRDAGAEVDEKVELRVWTLTEDGHLRLLGS